MKSLVAKKTKKKQQKKHIKLIVKLKILTHKIKKKTVMKNTVN
jgi:hypothetical protein